MVLFFGALILEAAGYLAFPFLGLQLRDGFGLSQVAVGVAMSVAIWVRPFASIFGGWISNKVRPEILLSIACVLEASCFLALGLSASATVAITGLVLGNVGLALWAPNLFAIASAIGPSSRETNRLAYLTGFLNAGAALGCVLGGIAAASDTRFVFVLTGIVYLLIIPVLLPVVRRLRNADKPLKSGSLSRGKLWSLPVAIAAVATVSYWAMYGQFISFFSVYVSDWLRDNTITGFAFAALALSVSAASYFYGRLYKVSIRSTRLVYLSSLIAGLGWIALSASPNVRSVAVFILALALSETFISVFLTKEWNSIFQESAEFAQGLHFAFRSIGMGAGGVISGYVYNNPQQAKSVASWSLSSVLLLMIFVAATLGYQLMNRRSTPIDETRS